jgi:selenocysteine-specific elongation factor
MTASPLTLGTAGHIDHGKTALVQRLTGTDTDRLPEERARGISIALGYARLGLPSGRALSVVDVPGHERFVRTMVAGATGIDLYLMVVAADDGVMPQTREHAAVLRALGVTTGVVAVTKADLTAPERAAAEAAELLPRAPVVACSARTGAGLAALRAELDAVAAALPGRAGEGSDPVLHVDRVFTIRGAGTVVTGTLWSGRVAAGDVLAVRPGGRRARVRSVHVHDAPVASADAGQRVALNLAGVPAGAVARGDVVCDPERGPEPTYRVEAALGLRHAPAARVQVHHGARDAPARLTALAGDGWQLRLEQPLLARAGDRLVIRSIAPPDTLGGGVVVDAAPSRRTTPDPVTAAPAPRPAPAQPDSPALSQAARALEAQLRAAGHEPPAAAALDAEALRALRAAGRAVRVGRDLYAHPDALAAVRDRVETLIGAEGAVSMARLRDELGTSRKFAQALLEHLDAARITLRLPDDRRVLRRGRGAA